MRVTVRIDASDALKLPDAILGAVNQQLNGNAPGPIADMFTQWGRRYERDVRDHFRQASRGGADWPPLAPATILARRAKGGGTRGQQRAALAAKLRGTQSKSKSNSERAATLKAKLANEHSAVIRARIKAKIQALTSSAGTSILMNTGALFAALRIGATGNLFTRKGNVVTYGFLDSKHPGGGKQPTLAQIAGWHDAGGEHLPRRRILIDPSPSLIASMESDGLRAMDRVLQSSRR